MSRRIITTKVIKKIGGPTDGVFDIFHNFCLDSGDR